MSGINYILILVLNNALRTIWHLLYFVKIIWEIYEIRIYFLILKHGNKF